MNTELMWLIIQHGLQVFGLATLIVIGVMLIAAGESRGKK